MRRLPVLVATACATLAVPASVAVAKVRTPHRLPAAWQKKFHVRSATADTDHDGLTNWTEFRARTSPRRVDTDRDGTPDGGEDRDRDRLANATEQRAGTDPAVRDSDRDGRSDAREDADGDGLRNLGEQQTANDPGDPDSDDDGVADGEENAGQIVSVDDDVVVLRLAATGQTVTGVLDDATAVQCATAEEDQVGDDDTADDDANADDDGDDEDAPADDAADDERPAPSSGDEDVQATGDEVVADCEGDELEPGAWVHEAELSTDDEDATVFEALVLVTDGV